MADLDQLQSADAVYIVGANSTGVETNPVNSTPAGGLHVSLRDGTGSEILGQKSSANSIPVVLPSDAPGQAGVVNDGSLFSAAAVTVAGTAGIDNPLMLITNPTSSTKPFFIWRSRFGSTTANVTMGFKIFSNPVVTSAGTTLSPMNRSVGGSYPNSVAQVTKVPTVSANGELLTALNVGQNNNSIDMNEEFAIKINPGNTLMITANPSTNNREVTITVVWQEKS